jgi:hypothetical protein
VRCSGSGSGVVRLPGLPPDRDPEASGRAPKRYGRYKVAGEGVGNSSTLPDRTSTVRRQAGGNSALPRLSAKEWRACELPSPVIVPRTEAKEDGGCKKSYEP